MRPAARGLVLLAVLALPGCAAAPASRKVASCTGPGALEVRNLTGGVVEVYEMRVGDRRYLGLVSPGTQSFPVVNAADPNVTYLVRDPRNGDGTTVTWRARKTRVSENGIELTLKCGRTS